MCPFCNLKESKERKKMAYTSCEKSFLNTDVAGEEENDFSEVFILKDNLVHNWIMEFFISTTDYDLRHHELFTHIPISYCPFCGRKLE